MGFYDDMQDVVDDVLSEFKQGVIQYIELIPGTGPDENPGPPSEKPPVTLDAVARKAEFRYVNGTTIIESDVQISFAIRTDIEFKVDDFVTVDGVRMKITRAMTIPPAGTPVLHVLFARR